MNEFIKCPEGHVFSSEFKECPYCSGKELDDDLENLPSKKIERLETAMCYDMGPDEFRNDFDLDDDKEDDVKLSSLNPLRGAPPPPSCYAPAPPKFKRL